MTAPADKPAAPMTVERLEEIVDETFTVTYDGEQTGRVSLPQESFDALIAEVERLRGEVERLKAQEKAYINPPGEEWPR